MIKIMIIVFVPKHRSKGWDFFFLGINHDGQIVPYQTERSAITDLK